MTPSPRRYERGRNPRHPPRLFTQSSIFMCSHRAPARSTWANGQVTASPAGGTEHDAMPTKGKLRQPEARWPTDGAELRQCDKL